MVLSRSHMHENFHYGIHVDFPLYDQTHQNFAIFSIKCTPHCTAPLPLLCFNSIFTNGIAFLSNSTCGEICVAWGAFYVPFLISWQKADVFRVDNRFKVKYLNIRLLYVETFSEAIIFNFKEKSWITWQRKLPQLLFEQQKRDHRSFRSIFPNGKKSIIKCRIWSVKRWY